jgi:hypothetical protein
MIEARTALMATDWEPVVHRALIGWDDVGTALRMLEVLPPERLSAFADALLPMAIVTHGHLGTVRRLLASLGRGWMSANARDFVEQTISSPASTYEEFRRLAELLRELDEAELLDLLVEAARTDDDPDIVEVADDFRRRA